ncbi:MAG: trimeric intracellular cation channel family protein [Actinomycetota bacterium]
MAEPVALLDIAGIYVFALSGCLVALRHNMDVVGVLTLGLVTGFGGGVARDVLIADLPPQLVRTNGLLLIPVAAAVTALAVPGLLDRFRQPVLVLDAIGLGLFATVGAAAAIDAGLGVVPTVLVGTIAAVGGGLVRDLLANELPQILARGSRLYAIPAALGALVVALGAELDLAEAPVQLLAAILTVGLRLLALRYGWHAPARPLGSSGAATGEVGA